MAETHLDISRTYAAIVAAARQGRFVSYVDLANASRVPWSKARLPIGQHLDKLLAVAKANGWPLLTVNVVRKDDVESGRLTGGALHGFLSGVKRLGMTVADSEANAFIRAEQRRTFEWAAGAPDAPDFSAFPLRAPAQVAEPGSEYGTRDATQYWFVGAVWDGVDQSDRFIAEGIWQNGYENDPLVDQIRPGDRIAIKSTFVRKHNLPFDVGGRPVSTMRIKAIGTVRENLGDHATVKVDWQPLRAPLDWFFYTFRVTLIRADRGNPHASRLIDFAFDAGAQDYAWWLDQPYFRRKYAAEETAADAEETPAPDAEDADYTIEDILRDGCFVEADVLELALERLRKKKNLILQGPPGTGKTWLAKRLGYALIQTKAPAVIAQRMRVVQFHPTTSYEDFVRGWRPGTSGKLELTDGIFLQAVEAARAEGDPFIVVVEEINRGNPAQIFGEMLTLLEASKRTDEDEIELAYRSEGRVNRIRLPENLYLIGTMNLADRSLAMVDMALRRRFAFVTLAPSFGAAWHGWCVEKGLPPALIDAIRDRMGALNERIRRTPSLGEQYCIGHSYFTPNAREDDVEGWYEAIVETEIKPLLDEYWYDHPTQVADAIEELRTPWS